MAGRETSGGQPQVQHQSSTHMMKTTKSGRPFIKDIHDLFSTLVVSLPLDTHRYLFRQYPNTFTTEEAVANLGSLKFTQSKRSPDPKDPSRIITTTTTTTFSMTKDMAKNVCQTFMDARLFENATDSTSKTFRDKNIYALTPKGLYVLGRFVEQNGITSQNLSRFFASSPTHTQIFDLERSPVNDSLLLGRPVIEKVFSHFAGTQPNDITHKDKDKDGDREVLSDGSSGSSNDKGDRSLGVELKERQQNHKAYRNTFYGLHGLDWLCDFTTAIAKEEAVKIANEFLRFGFIEAVPDRKSEKQDQQQEPKISRSTLYQVTENGCRIAWGSDNPKTSVNVGFSPLAGRKVDDHPEPTSVGGKNPRHRSHRSSISEKQVDSHPIKPESSTKRLQQILVDPTLCSLFMDFLKANFCEENLLFLLDVKKFKSKYNNDLNEQGEPKDPKYKQPLIEDAFRIYADFLAPASPNELNIEHSLRQNMIQYMTSILEHSKEAATSEQPTHPASSIPIITIRLYDKIEDTIFRLMASDSVPRFVKTEKYQSAAYKRRSADSSGAVLAGPSPRKSAEQSPEDVSGGTMTNGATPHNYSNNLPGASGEIVNGEAI